MKDQTEVGYAFAWDNITNPILAITAKHSLFPSSYTHIANSSPYGLPTTWVAIWAYPVPLEKHNALGSALSTDNFMSMIFLTPTGISSYVPFWLQLVSTLSWLPLTAFISSSHRLTLASSLAI